MLKGAFRLSVMPLFAVVGPMVAGNPWLNCI